MADVAIPAQHWRSLRRSANCFIPKLVRASASLPHGFSNSDLYRAGQGRKLDREFSLHIVGNVMLLRPVTHDKAEQLLEAYRGLPEELQKAHGPLDAGDIVAALFSLPTLRKSMEEAGISKEELAKGTGVSLGCIEYALTGGRVTAGIVAALHSVLVSRNKEVPGIREFTTSRVTDTIGHKAVKGTPFELDDLLLPTPANSPEQWP